MSKLGMISQHCCQSLLLSLLLTTVHGTNWTNPNLKSRFPLRILTLGDSFAAGNGARDRLDNRNYSPTCYRSGTSWSGVYRECISHERQATLDIEACSGAVLLDSNSDGTGEPMWRISNQVAKVNPMYDLIFVTALGNDLKFESFMFNCMIISYTDACKALLEQAIEEVPSYEEELVKFLRTIRSRARLDTKVVLVGYPFLVMNDDEKLLTMSFEPFSFSNTLHKLQLELAKIQHNAVVKANLQEGETFVFFENTTDLFFGHEMYPRADLFDEIDNPVGWLTDFNLMLYSKAWSAEIFHFNSFGHEALGKFLCMKGDFGAGLTSPFEKIDIDMVFVIDTSKSMEDEITAVNEATSQILTSLAEMTQSYRVAVIDYRDFSNRTNDALDYPAKLDLNFTNDEELVKFAIANLTLGSLNDSPKTVWSALMMALSLEWRAGVQKLIIHIGNSPPLNPEPFTGFTIEDIIQKSLSLQPITIFSLGTNNPDDKILQVTNATGGSVFIGETSAFNHLIINAINMTSQSPFAWFGKRYTGYVGLPVIFDGSGSYAKQGTLVSWEWDTNNDGVYEIQTTVPILNHTFPKEYSGLVALRVTDSKGNYAIATANVDVSVDGDGIPAEVDNCPMEYNVNQVDRNGNGIGDVCDPAGLPYPIIYPLRIRFTGEYYGYEGKNISVIFETLDPNPADFSPLTAAWNVSKGCTLLSILSERSATIMCPKSGTYELLVSAGTMFSTRAMISTSIVVLVADPPKTKKPTRAMPKTPSPTFPKGTSNPSTQKPTKRNKTLLPTRPNGLSKKPTAIIMGVTKTPTKFRSRAPTRSGMI
jgi:lysophospholipase L1-like esterase